MIKPKNATHELDGVFYKKSYGVEIYRPYSKVSGRLSSIGHVFKKDSTNKPVPV